MRANITQGDNTTCTAQEIPLWKAMGYLGAVSTFPASCPRLCTLSAWGKVQTARKDPMAFTGQISWSCKQWNVHIDILLCSKLGAIIVITPPLDIFYTME